MYLVLTYSEFKPDMVNGHYNQYEYHPAIHVWDIRKIHNRYNKICINILFWHRAKVYFMLLGTGPRYILHASHPYCGWLLCQIWTKLTYSFLRYCNKHIKFKKNIAIITQMWHRTKCYFTCISNTWHLITVPNMNKHILLSDITKCMKKCP